MESTTTRAVIAILGIALLSVAAVGQQRPLPLEQLGRPPLPPPEGTLIDTVFGVIGDKAILESEIQAQLESTIRGWRNAGIPVTDLMIAERRRGIVYEIQREQAMAQAARVMPGTTRAQIDALVDRLLEEEMREQEAKAGSVNRLRDQLGILGETFRSQIEERRTERLAAIAWRRSMHRHWHDSFALSVTPEQMRRYYEEHRNRFVYPASADLEVIAIPAGDDPAAGAATAREAAEAWRSGAAAMEVAERFGGTVLQPRESVRDVESDPNIPPIKEFAGRAQLGDVSEPIPREGQGGVPRAFWILKAVATRQGRNGLFRDREIQAEILEELVRQRLLEAEERLFWKNSKRFRLWRLPRSRR